MFFLYSCLMSDPQNKQTVFDGEGNQVNHPQGTVFTGVSGNTINVFTG